MIKNEGDRLSKVIICSPGNEYFDVKQTQNHNITEVAEASLATAQHNLLKSVMQNFGCEVFDFGEFPGFPNSVFTRDTALCTPNGYISFNMGLESRKGEAIQMDGILKSMGIPKAGVIVGDGTVEGGDVILAGTVAFIGNSKRTNEEGVKQISALLTSMGFEIRTTKVPPMYLHIGGAMSMIGKNKVICCKGVFPENFFNGFEKIEVSADSFISANVICLGDNEVIADSSNIETVNKLKNSGIIVHAIDLSEFVKGTGGPSCLILPIERKE